MATQSVEHCGPDAVRLFQFQRRSVTVRCLCEAIARVEIGAAQDGGSKTIKKAAAPRFGTLAIFNWSIQMSQSKVLRVLPADDGKCEEVPAELSKADIYVGSLTARLQDEGARSFVKSWNNLMKVIASKSAMLKEAVV